MNYSNIEFHWDDRKEILVLAEDKKSVCRIHIYKDEEKTAYLTDLHVLEEVRQQGRGSEILDYCTGLAKENGCANVELRCDSVGWLSEWYMRKGFNVVGLQLNKSIE